MPKVVRQATASDASRLPQRAEERTRPHVDVSDEAVPSAVGGYPIVSVPCLPELLTVRSIVRHEDPSPSHARLRTAGGDVLSSSV